MFKGNENGKQKSFSWKISDDSLNDTKNANTLTISRHERYSQTRYLWIFFCVEELAKKHCQNYTMNLLLWFHRNNLLFLSARKRERGRERVTGREREDELRWDRKESILWFGSMRWCRTWLNILQISKHRKNFCFQISSLKKKLFYIYKKLSKLCYTSYII